MKFYRSTKFTRTFIIVSAILLQAFIFINMFLFFQDYSKIINFITIILSILIVLFILNKDTNPNYKLAWIIPILITPIFGSIFYLFFGTNQLSFKERRRMSTIDHVTRKLLPNNYLTINHLKNTNISAYRQSKYIQDFGHFPPTENTKSWYFSSGEDLFNSMKEELMKAQHFIFMEYFIVNEGKMWKELLDILILKAKQGVDVRFIYDDFGCLMTLPNNYNHFLENNGVKTAVFNPLLPILSSKYNTRNHRKLTVIDNNVSFTGGINLADEYINEIERFGHWKDVGIKLEGAATWNFTVMFLTMWDYLKSTSSPIKNFKLKSTLFDENDTLGIIQPFSDNPLDDEPVGQNVYLNLINKAEQYIYICTPYLVIDDEMSNALTNAAKAGVDVKIITPHIPDKWYVHMVSRSYYPKLQKFGVKIYEYTPGFIHSKTFLVDDLYSTVGSINLDYRSLYLHFECGVWTYKSGIEYSIKEDFDKTLAESLLMDTSFYKKYSLFKRFLSGILRIFSPMM